MSAKVDENPKKWDSQKEKIVAGALFDFLGYLTTRDEEIVLSGHHHPGPGIKALQDWAALRGLNLKEADVMDYYICSTATNQEAFMFLKLCRQKVM